MYRSDRSKPERIDFNLAISAGGMGDAVAALPVFKYIFDNYSQNHQFTCWVPDYFIEICNYVFPKANFRGLSEQHKINSKLPTFHTNIKIPTFLRVHLTDYASLLLADIILKPNQKNYIKIDTSNYTPSKQLLDTLQGKDISKFVFFTTLFTSDTRHFHGSEINKISKYVHDIGLTPCFIGKEKSAHSALKKIDIHAKSDAIDYTNCINLVNTTSLLDIVWLFNQGKAVIGLDNGLLHLACCTDILVFGAFTSVDPDHRLPYRNNIKGLNFVVIEPDYDLECKYCQSNWPYDVKQNFTKCFYGDYLCCKQITGEKFISALQQYLVY